jgi:putative transposase
MIQCDAVTCPAGPARTGYFLVVETQKKEPGMRFEASIFSALLEPISRRSFAACVQRHGGDAYDKSFSSWQHLVALVYAQLGHTSSLRSLETSWNAHGHHHYHLGCGRLSRATLADANKRRPPAIFAETFAQLSGLADRALRRDGRAMIRLIDSSPIPLDRLSEWRAWNGRIRGLKLHVVYDPHADHPSRVDITQANVNDVEIGSTVTAEAGATYVFDKGYCDYAWWQRIHAAQALFVTRKKSNARFEAIERRELAHAEGDGFTVIEDCEVSLASKGKDKERPRLVMPLRRIEVQRDDAGSLTLLTNDMIRSAVEVAALYKLRWQIELLFRWLKQNLKLARFLGRSDNAVRLQIYAAMIAFLLLRLAARSRRITLQPIRFAELVGECLMQRRRIDLIDKSPNANNGPPKPNGDPRQLSLDYA